MNDSMNDLIGDCTRLIRDGRIREAYRRILTFMSTLKTRLEKQHPHHGMGALYAGTMDMTCFSFTPPALRQRKLKIVLVYLHGENCFEAWLGGANRRIQAQWIQSLSGKVAAPYHLSEVSPGVDSILALRLAPSPDFDHPGKLMNQLEETLFTFSNDMIRLIEPHPSDAPEFTPDSD